MGDREPELSGSLDEILRRNAHVLTMDAMKTDRSNKTNHAVPPGPRGLLFLSVPRHLLSRERELKYVMQLVSQYGDFVKLPLPGGRVYLLNHPDFIKQVLQYKHENYTRSPTFERFKIVLGENLLTSEGEFWRNRRRLEQPAFHHKKVAEYSEIIIDCTPLWLIPRGGFSGMNTSRASGEDKMNPTTQGRSGKPRRRAEHRRSFLALTLLSGAGSDPTGADPEKVGPCHQQQIRGGRPAGDGEAEGWSWGHWYSQVVCDSSSKQGGESQSHSSPHEP